MPEHRGEHQAVFRLSVSLNCKANIYKGFKTCWWLVHIHIQMPEQKRLVWNRSVCFWECLNQGNSYDCRQIVGTLRRIIEPDEFDDCVFPKSKFNELSSQFQAAIESNSNWKRSVLTLHHIIKWLKSLIYLVSCTTIMTYLKWVISCKLYGHSYFSHSAYVLTAIRFSFLWIAIRIRPNKFMESTSCRFTKSILTLPNEYSISKTFRFSPYFWPDSSIGECIDFH